MYARRAAAVTKTKRARESSTPADAVAQHEQHEPLFVVDSPITADLSAAQREVLVAVANRENVFMTGRGGCGKSKTINALVDAARDAGLVVDVTATTGIAAEPLGGTTLHTFACLKFEGTTADAIKSATLYHKERLRACQILIIDEVSMASPELLRQVLDVLDAVRLKRAPRPVIVLVGDFCQLAPVADDAAQQLLFQSDVWSELALRVIVLQDSWRQSNVEFLSVLDEARFGELSPASIEFLRAHVGKRLDTSTGIWPTVLTPHRSSADAVNVKQLAALSTEAFVFPARVFVGVQSPPPASKWETILGSTDVSADVEGRQLRALFPTGLYSPRKPDFLFAVRAMMKNSLAPRLTLKVGAQVMFVANVSASVVNGSRGVITAITPQPATAATAATADCAHAPLPTVTVQLLNGTSVCVAPFSRTRPFPLPRHPKAAIVYEQLPLQLAWAITIHKSQGMSMDCAELDIGTGVFATGQAYVALSRLRDAGGMSLRRFDPAGIKANAAVVTWYKALLAAQATGSATLPTLPTNTTEIHADGESKSEHEDIFAALAETE